ncbi:MAG: hypothetical protein V1789_08470 [PVC group bacterium]
MGGVNRDSLRIARALYGAIVPATIPVSSPDAAEATKLLENIYRLINIALVNELKIVFVDLLPPFLLPPGAKRRPKKKK